MTETRDNDLARELERFTEPDHALGYWTDIRAQLDASSPSSEPTGDRAAPRRRRRTRSRQRSGARHARWLRVGLGAAAVLAAAIVATLTLVGLPGRDRHGGPETAMAAEVARRMELAASTTTTFQAHFESTMSLMGHDRDGNRVTGDVMSYEGTYATDAFGDERRETTRSTFMRDGRSRDMHECGLRVYNARSGKTLGIYPSQFPVGGYKEGTVFYSISDDPGDPTGGFRRYSSLVRAALVESAAGITVVETSYEGRPAWRATIPVTSRVHVDDPGNNDSSPAPGTVTVTVDQGSGFVVAGVVDTYEMRKVWRLSDLKVDEPVPADYFAVKPPGDPGIPKYPEEKSGADFWRVGTPAEAERAIGAPLLAVGWLPQGYEPTTVGIIWVVDHPKTAIDESSPIPWDEAEHGSWTATLNQQRGLDHLSISILVGAPFKEFAQGRFGPLEKARVYDSSARPVSLDAGIFAGATACTGLGFGTSEGFDDGLGVPWLAVTNGDYSVIIQGDATRDELERIAERLTAPGK